MSIYVRVWDVSSDLHNSWLAVFYYPDRRDRTRYLLVIEADWLWISADTAKSVAPRRHVEFGDLPHVAQRRLFEAAGDLV